MTVEIIHVRKNKTNFVVNIKIFSKQLLKILKTMKKRQELDNFIGKCYTNPIIY